jgi:hypothetical protein
MYITPVRTTAGQAGIVCVLQQQSHGKSASQRGFTPGVSDLLGSAVFVEDVKRLCMKSRSRGEVLLAFFPCLDGEDIFFNLSPHGYTDRPVTHALFHRRIYQRVYLLFNLGVRSWCSWSPNLCRRWRSRSGYRRHRDREEFSLQNTGRLDAWFWCIDVLIQVESTEHEDGFFSIVPAICWISWMCFQGLAARR